MSRVGRKPGPTPTLTRDDVARAALEEGVGAMSMPSVARRLGVSHSTLYRYVHDRDDLVLAALDLAVREFEWPAADLGWRELLVAFADALWRFLERHPGMAEAIQSAPGMPDRVTELATAYGVKLRADGIGARDAAVAIDFVADLTIATEIAMRGLGRTFDTPSGRRSLRELYQESWPDLGADESVLHGRGFLTDKLTLMLDGLAGRVGEPSRAAAGPEPREELVALALEALRSDGLVSPPMLARAATAFRAAGVPEPEVAFVAGVLWDHVSGAAVVKAARDRARAGVAAVVDGLLRHHV